MTPEKDWVLQRVMLTKAYVQWGPRVQWRYHVEVLNLSDAGRVVSWTLQDLDDPRYDRSQARFFLPVVR